MEMIDTRRGTFGTISHGPDEAPMVLLVHGFPDDATSFSELQNALAIAGFRSLSIAMRGYAPSPLGGSYAIDDLAKDVLSVADSVAPGEPLFYVGHDLGSQIGYALLTQAPGRFRRAVMLAGGHPAIIFANMRKVPRQWWLSRYIVGMQLPGVAEWRVSRDDFAFIERLWQRWSPGWSVPPTHLRHVKETLRQSMPAPVAMYRGGGFDIGDAPIDVPTLLIVGARDGCLDPRISDGQERLFTAEYRRDILPNIGHFPHLEAPDGVASRVVEWFGQPNG